MEILKIEDVFGDLPELQTPRLLLRKVRPEDAADMFEYASDPETTREVTWETHTSIEASKAFIDYTIKKYVNKQVSEWGLVLKENNKFIGTCGFVYWNPAHAKAEIGYALSRKYWGRGLMPEAVAAVMKFGFEKMKLHRLEARCNDTNPGSERVMIKSGMKYEGLLRDSMCEKGSFKNLKMYAILEGEYRK